VKIVSVMTTTSRGGAEFAAAELLDGRAARGHDVVMLNDPVSTRRDMRRPTGLRLWRIAIGPKLSVRSAAGLLLRFPQLLHRLRRALVDEALYDVLLVWAEWGPLPPAMRRWLPSRLYAAAAQGAAGIMAVSQATRASLRAVGLPAGLVTCNAFRP
jgi:hypothetical protein